MGYYTCFTLEVMTADNRAEHPNNVDIIAKLRQENENAQYALDELGCTDSDAKWYGHEDELREFSKEYPDALLILYGDGESSEDLWYAYFKNGKVQFAPVRFEHEEYDEDKLS